MIARSPLLPSSVATVIALLLGFPDGRASADQPTKQKPPNILFIAVDDLNHWVGHLGRNKQTRTPNIDALAARGVTFTHAYCAAPVCNPSRTALMSGLRPSTTGVYGNGTDWRPIVAPELTLISHLRKHGYYAAGCGKIYHGGFDRHSEWDEYFRPPGDPRPERGSGKENGVGGIKFAPLDAADEAMGDFKSTTWAIGRLEKTYDKPFILTVGYHKPHMPWNVPRKYYEQFPLDKIELPPYREDDLSDVPPAGVEMAGPKGDHAEMLASGRWKEAIQSYLAAISFLDGQVGRLIAALDNSPHCDNTVIVFFGDHGWHLGEKHHWRKFALWEEATRAPFIWVVPHVTPANARCEQTVDFMSIYPTLCELAGLPVPKHVEGMSIRPLLLNPNADLSRPALTTHGYKNHAVRTNEYRFIRYANGDEELYNERDDPYEWTNLASKASSAAIKQQLSAHFPKSDQEPPERPRRAARRAAKQQ